MVDDKTLKDFVDEFGEYFLNLVHRSGVQRALATKNCERVLPWKHGSVYLFRMVGEQVAFNGNTPELEERNLNVKDIEGTDVGKKILEAVENLPDGEGTYVNYYWDDPRRRLMTMLTSRSAQRVRILVLPVLHPREPMLRQYLWTSAHVPFE